MSQLVTVNPMPAITQEALERIAPLEDRVRELPQIDPPMEHLLHGGMYARTCRLDAGVVIVSVLIKVPTVVIVHGKCAVYAGRRFDVNGYAVIPADRMRKAVYVTLEPTEITMVFPTKAKTLEEAEREFTDDKLLEATNEQVMITGVEACLA